MKTENKDRVCDECGSIHKDGISWHGRCYHCGGDLIAWNADDHELTAVTPKGIEIYERKKSLSGGLVRYDMSGRMHQIKK